MSYRIVQPQKNGNFYLYDAESVWDPEKKASKQKRRYLGKCDKDGNLIAPRKDPDAIICSPVYGTGYLLHQIMKDIGLDRQLEKVYGERDGKRLEALAILGVTCPSSVRMMECNVEDTYVRELIGTDWSFEQSEVCRFMQSVGKDAGRREELFELLAPRGGCMIFDIVCLGTDSDLMEYAEVGRKMHITGSKQFNLGMVHSMEDHLPFMYRTYPGSVADVTTLRNITEDLAAMGCTGVEMVMDRGFFSLDNIRGMIVGGTGFTVPIPARSSVLKPLLSESVGKVDTPSNTDMVGGDVVRGYETGVVMLDKEFKRASEAERDVIRVVVIQDDSRRLAETTNLYSRISDLEKRLNGRSESDGLPMLKKKEVETLNLFEQTYENGTLRLVRKRNAISAKENACGRFALMTTSERDWKGLLIEYRARNDVEYDFSQLQSDLFDGVKGKSDQESAEGGLMVSFLSLRLRTALLNRMKENGLTDRMWISDVMGIMRKLKISQVGGRWRLNEMTRAQKDIFEGLGIKPPF